MLTLERAKEINKDMITEDHLILHSNNVSYAMGAMADHFGEDRGADHHEPPEHLYGASAEDGRGCL